MGCDGDVVIARSLVLTVSLRKWHSNNFTDTDLADELKQALLR